MQTLVERCIDHILMHFSNICFYFINNWMNSFSMRYLCKYFWLFLFWLIFFSSSLWGLGKGYYFASVSSEEVEICWAKSLTIGFYKISWGRPWFLRRENLSGSLTLNFSDVNFSLVCLDNFCPVRFRFNWAGISQNLWSRHLLIGIYFLDLLLFCLKRF